MHAESMHAVNACTGWRQSPDTDARSPIVRKFPAGYVTWYFAAFTMFIGRWNCNCMPLQKAGKLANLPCLAHWPVATVLATFGPLEVRFGTWASASASGSRQRLYATLDMTA
jgi:hypothetical protein